MADDNANEKALLNVKDLIIHIILGSQRMSGTGTAALLVLERMKPNASVCDRHILSFIASKTEEIKSGCCR
jgi:hypothetical protein